jgi:hypothetical protein
MSANLTSSEPRAKRIKIDVACNTCRARKVKCDGVRPGERLAGVQLAVATIRCWKPTFSNIA